MEFDASEVSEQRLYGCMIAAIVPRPIAVVGTVSAAGAPNLAPYSFFTGISSRPPLVAFCPANREDGGEKDTLANLKPREEGGTGCFTISVATDAIVRQVVACSEPLPAGASEFALSGLTPGASRRVIAPHVAESPVHFECETLEIRRFAPGEPDGGNLVVGRIVHVRVDDAVLDARGRIDPAKLDAVGRMGGIGYARTRERLDIPRGIAALSRSSSQTRP
ncbi:MAG: flavin reductase family protein [Planctomycetota bacterium]